MRFLIVPTDSDSRLPTVHQCLDVLRLERSGIHVSETKHVELIGDQRQQPLAVALRRISAIVVTVTQLFELVVQVSHGVTMFW